jgi:hypothetical protein
VNEATPISVIWSSETILNVRRPSGEVAQAVMQVAMRAQSKVLRTRILRR